MKFSKGAAILAWLLLVGMSLASTAPEAVVQISCEVGRSNIIGTGILVSSTRILTADHVVSSGGRLTVTFQSGQRYYATRVDRDVARDLALLAISEVSVRPIRISQTTPAIGDVLYTAGFGATREPLRVTSGALLSFVGLDRQTPGGAIRIRGGVRLGDSGGPIVNASGHLVGVIARTDYGSVYGTHCVGIREFFGRGRSQQKQPCPDGRCEVDELPSIDLNVFPLPDAPAPQPIDDDRFAAIDARLDAIMTMIESIPSGSQGEQGVPGAAGQQGQPGIPGVAGEDAQVDPIALGPRDPILTTPLRDIAKPARTFDWGSTLGMAAMAASGATGVGVPLWALMLWRGNRLRKRLRPDIPPHKIPPASTTYVVDSPPSPGTHRIDTQFINVESDHYQRAHEMARQQIARKYPGSQEILAAELSLTQQYAAGLPE